MDPITETPTQPVDYAVLNAAYGGLLATVAFAARRRAAEVEPIGTAELLPLGAATFALSKAIVHEKVDTWLRQPFVEGDGTSDRRPRGQGMRYAVGELLTCSRCMGTWSALALVSLRLVRPPSGRAVISVLAAAAINDFLQTGFAYVREASNAQASVAEHAGNGAAGPAPRAT